MEIPFKDSSIIQVVDYLKLRHLKLLSYADTKASAHQNFYGFELDLTPGQRHPNKRVYLAERLPAHYKLTDHYNRPTFEAELFDYLITVVFLFNEPTPGFLPDDLSFTIDWPTIPNTITGTGIRLTYTPQSNKLTLQQLYVLGIPNYSSVTATRTLPKQPTDPNHLLAMLQDEITSYQKVIAL